MFIPTKNINTISLYNYYSEALGYRKHSALKIRVKPRQALASVNIKLMEQQQRSRTGSSFIRTDEELANAQMKPVSSSREEMMASQTTPTNNSTASNDDMVQMNSTAFRPSTVKKRIAAKQQPTNGDIQFIRTKSSFQLVDTTSSSSHLKKQNSTPSPSSSLQSKESDIDYVKIRRNKTDLHGMDDFSKLIKPKEMQPSTSTNDITDCDVYIKNLNEQQFLTFLREYRKSANVINLDKLNKLNLNLNSTDNQQQQQQQTSVNSSQNDTLASSRTPSPRSVTASTSIINLATTFATAPGKNKSNSIPSHKSSNYYLNYLNNRMQVKNAKNAGGEETTNDDGPMRKSQTQPNGEPNKSSTAKSSKVHPLKILNFPTTAN